MKNYLLLLIVCLLMPFCVFSQATENPDPAKNKQTGGMMVRIAEIEIHPQFIKTYLSILKEEAAASVKLEPGVISIMPMFPKGDSTQIRILEIYADKDAYQSHLKTPHFLKYKTTTAAMVKSLKLLDMNPIDAETLPLIFRKMGSN